MIYAEYAIVDTLKPFIKVIWSMESDISLYGGTPIYILPDTCVELVVHFGDPYKTTFSNNHESIQPQSMVVAQMKSHIKIQPNGKTGILAVRFTALGAHHFFGSPMKEIANGEVSLRSLWKNLALEIEEKIYRAESAQQRASLIQTYLQIQLGKNGHIDSSVDFCVKRIKATYGQVSIDQLAREAGLSNRQLLRRFDRYIGLTPKEFARITKFIGSLDVLNANKNKSLTEVALDSGYYDQSHFIHDFQEFSGMTPSDYLISTNVVY